ncbi:MAG TPA: FAD-dependent oxidoreductase [Candidatus Sulfotelmatobacter sp.]|jgi:protoporphyrinogen oxidase|nr:FAD-dependent oxidoreductase [Candidatus Sulfotelmatobacter sp.]
MSLANIDVMIVGGGPCGLGAAWRFSSSPSSGKTPSFLLFDNHNRPGGWARSVTKHGFTFDFGGHVLFPHKHYQAFLDVLNDLQIEWASSCPERGTWTGGRFIPYPVQQNIHRLPLLPFLQCSLGIAGRRIGQKLGFTSPPSNDLAGYLSSAFGQPLRKIVLGPLNHKMWAYRPDELDSSWCGHKSGSATCNVPSVSLSRLAWQFISSSDSPGWDPNTKVSYPKGGSGEVWRQIAERVPAEKLNFGVSLTALDLEEHLAFLSDGRVYRYERMISAVPLDNLLRLLRYQPALSEMAQTLKYSRSYLVGLGIRGELPQYLSRAHSLLVPDSDIPFWRLNFPSNVSASNVPGAGYWSALCEVSELPSGGPPMEKSVVLAKVIAGLKKMRLLRDEADLVTHWCVRLEHGYPTPFLGRDDVLNEIQPQLEGFGILSRGRFGAWKYEVSNQDHAFMQGVEAADLAIAGKAEETYTNSSLVNR